LLKLYGGLWVDASTFCNQPLNEWLPSYVSEDFFVFEKPAHDRLISSWFIYAEKESYIITKWYESVIDYYKKHDNPHTYFWFHYLFGELYNHDFTFRKLWDNVIKISANGLGPHYLQEKGLCNKLNIHIKNDIDNKITPLYKLTYKCNFPPHDNEVNIYYLYSTIP